MEQKLNGALLSIGFRVEEDGSLAKYTIEGRRRKNWKNNPRQRSRQFLKENCERCGVSYVERKLTIHHIIPLRKAKIISEDNCQTLCRPCHDEIEKQEKNNYNGCKIVKGLWGEWRII